MKIAVISDIHANLEALKTTLEDIKKRNVDKVICLGDIIAKGTHPMECIELVKENCNIVLRGNCDRHIGSKHILEEMPELEQQRLVWNTGMITKEYRDYLFELPFSYEFYMSGSLVRLFHATPTQDNKAIISFDNIETRLEMFKPSEKTISQKNADIVIYGHIHHPYLDKLYNKTIINVGSVGNAFDDIRNPKKDSNVLETTKSNYLIIEGEYGSTDYTQDISFQFIKVPYNINKELQDKKYNLEQQDYEYELKEGRYRNMKKINDKFKQLGVDIDKI